MTPAPPPRAWALFAVCVALWGSAYAIVRVALTIGEAEPWVVVAGRLWLAALLLGALLAWRRRRELEPPATPGIRGKLVLLGVFGAAMPFALLSWAQTSLDSGLVAILSALTPILVTGAAPLLGLEARLTWPRVAGVLSGFAGVVVLVGPDALSGLFGASVLAVLAAAGAAAAYAVNTLIARAGRPIPALEAAAGWTFYGALIATPFGLWQAAAEGGPTLVGWGAIAALALGPTAIASLAYFHLIRTTGPSFVTQTNYVIPLWAVLLGAVAFGETLSPQALFALGLIGGGLFVAQEGWRSLRGIRRSPPARPPHHPQ